jgi:hypothetical protein
METSVTDYVRRYECTGAVYHDDATSPVDCECVATQAHDGTLRLECLSARMPAKWLEGLTSQPINALAFRGRLASGAPITAEGSLLGDFSGWSREHGTRAIFHLSGKSHLLVGTQDTGADWRFAITNLVFTVPRSRQESSEAPRGTSLPLQLGPVHVSVAQVPDYATAKTYLRGRHGVHVTAEAVLPGSLSFESAQEVASDLCSLLSIAQGTFINWIYCEQRDPAQQILFTRHHPAVTRPYNGALPLIDPNAARDLPVFLETVFDRFREQLESYQLRKISRAYADVQTASGIWIVPDAVSSVRRFPHRNIAT